MQGAVYDLCVATPHEPDGARYTAAEWAIYAQGYDCALRCAMKALEATERRWHLFLRTRCLEARRRREAK